MVIVELTDGKVIAITITKTPEGWWNGHSWMYFYEYHLNVVDNTQAQANLDNKLLYYNETDKEYQYMEMNTSTVCNFKQDDCTWDSFHFTYNGKTFTTVLDCFAQILIDRFTNVK